MFINIKGKVGKYNAIVTWFYRDNLDYLMEVIPRIYMREFGKSISKDFYNIKSIKGLKEFIKEEMVGMDNYPYGFKYIEGTFALYECIC